MEDIKEQTGDAEGETKKEEGKVKSVKKVSDKKPKIFLAKENKDKIVPMHSQAYSVLVKALTTEKGIFLKKENKYIFQVNVETNKLAIKKAIKDVFGVEPIAVNIVNKKGKTVSRGKIKGKRKDTKKAIVTMTDQLAIKN